MAEIDKGRQFAMTKKQSLRLFNKIYNIRFCDMDLPIKVVPKWLMKLMFLTGKYHRLKIDDGYILLKKS